MNNVKLFSERLKMERDILNLTQEQLAEKIFVPRQYISDFENGKKEPYLDILIKLANEFNVSIDYLSGRIENREIINVDISTQTGLSPKSIYKLNKFTIKDSWQLDALYGDLGNYQDFSNIINKIIEDENFEKLIYFMRAYINSFKKEELEQEIKYSIFPEMYDNIKDFDTDYNCTKTDLYNYKINKIYNKIVDSITNDLQPIFSKRWTLNEEKSKVVLICKDGSEEKKLLKGRGIKGVKKGVKKNNGSTRNNKK